VGWVDPASTIVHAPEVTAAGLDAAVAANYTTWGEAIVGVKDGLPYAFATLGGAVGAAIALIGSLLAFMSAREMPAAS